MTSTTDLTTWTPQQIDSALSDLHQAIARARQQSEWAWDRVTTEVRKYLNLGYRDRLDFKVQRDVLSELDEQRQETLDIVDGGTERHGREAWSKAYRASQVLEAFDKAEIAESNVDNAILATQPYDEEFDRRGGWTRAFLVNNSNGHVHSSMRCSTCFPTTSYEWRTELSDHDEAEIITAAGERACTVCYPNAPVEDLERPTSLFTKSEQEKQQARVEREEKRAAKAAAEITATVYDYSDHLHSKTFKSERAVTNYIASRLSDLAWYGTEHPSASRWADDVRVLVVALQEKGVEYDYDKALAAARKKVTREGGSPKF